MLSRYHFLRKDYLRSIILFLGSALLAFASVWIIEKEFVERHESAPVQVARAQAEDARSDSIGLSHQLNPGMRAMSVKVNEVAGVAGFALPGSLVDVLVNTQETSATTLTNEHSISKIILEKVRVLAVAQETHHDDTKPKVVNAVTLELTPEQSELLDLARNVGTLSLVLRNQDDLALVSPMAVTRQRLLAGVSPTPMPLKVALAPDASPLEPSVQFDREHQNQGIELIKGIEQVDFFSGKRKDAR